MTNLSVSDKPDYDLGKSSIMKEAMYCVCGFSTQSGNKLAKHLGNHGCQSAYASLEEAEKARIMPEGREDNVSVLTRDMKTGLQGEKEQGNNDDNDKKNVEGDSVAKDVAEGDKIETKATKEEYEAETSNTEQNDKEKDMPPGPGGLLFGTLFKYMEEKHEEELGTENQTEEQLDDGVKSGKETVKDRVEKEQDADEEK